MSVSCLGATEPIEGPLVADCDLWCLSLDTLLPRISLADSPLMILSELSVPVIEMMQEKGCKRKGITMWLICLMQMYCANIVSDH